MIFTSPVILAILLGMTVSLVKPYLLLDRPLLTDYADTVLNWLGGLTVPLICLVIGYELQFQGRGIGKAVKAIAVRLGLVCTAAFLIDTFLLQRLFNMPVIYSAALWTLFILPPPFVIMVFMSDADSRDRSYITNTLSLHTIVTAVLLVVVAAALSGRGILYQG
jgi:predicted permease